MSVALLTQHAKPMRHIILSSVVCLALPHFSTLSDKRHDFRKTLLNIQCVLWFSLQLLSETSTIPKRIQRGLFCSQNQQRSFPYTALTGWFSSGYTVCLLRGSRLDFKQDYLCLICVRIWLILCSYFTLILPFRSNRVATLPNHFMQHFYKCHLAPFETE